jgi:hypothetical protein
VRIKTDCHCVLFFQSTIFTGRSGYVSAALWVIGGIIFLGTILVSKIFCRKRKEKYTEFDYFLERYQILTVILCIILAGFVM